MSKQKVQITLPENSVKLLLDMCEKKGFSKSIIIAMAIEQMALAGKGESNEDK